MKKTLFALLAFSSAALAFENAIWSFEDINTPTPAIDGLTCNNVNGERISYEDSGLTQGKQFGSYQLTQSLGKAINFDNNTRISITSNNWSSEEGALTLTKDVTFIAWVYVPTIQTEQFLFATGSTDAKGVGFDLQNGALTLTSKSKAHNIISEAIVTAGEWTNIAITYNAEHQLATAYINGDEKGTITLGATAINAADGYAVINSNGTNNQAGSKALKMAELQILSGALTQAQVLEAAHLEEIPSPSVPEPATATLSLLALAGLAARRRRR